MFYRISSTPCCISLPLCSVNKWTLWCTCGLPGCLVACVPVMKMLIAPQQICFARLCSCRCSFVTDWHPSLGCKLGWYSPFSCIFLSTFIPAMPSKALVLLCNRNQLTPNEVHPLFFHTFFLTSMLACLHRRWCSFATATSWHPTRCSPSFSACFVAKTSSCGSCCSSTSYQVGQV